MTTIPCMYHATIIAPNVKAPWWRLDATTLENAKQEAERCCDGYDGQTMLVAYGNEHVGYDVRSSCVLHDYDWYDVDDDLPF